MKQNELTRQLDKLDKQMGFFKWLMKRIEEANKGQLKEEKV